MKRRHIATCITLGVLGVGPALAQPRQGASANERQRHLAMQGMNDAQFVTMMIRHHQHGIEMARAEETRGASASVKALAAKIRQSQEEELAELKTQAQHHAGAAGPREQADHDKMMEQQSQAMIARLKSASGPALDHAFLEQMTKHHEMAITMTEGAKIEDPQLKRLAQKMVEEQRRELAELMDALSVHTAPN